MIVDNNKHNSKSTGIFTREEVQRMATMTKTERERFIRFREEELKKQNSRKW